MDALLQEKNAFISKHVPTLCETRDSASQSTLQRLRVSHLLGTFTTDSRRTHAVLDCLQQLERPITDTERDSLKTTDNSTKQNDNL